MARLGDHCELLTGFPFKSSQYTDESDALPLLRGDNIGQGQISWAGAKRWPSSGVADLDAYLLEPGDVVLAMDRPWITAGLKYSKLRNADCPSLLVQRVARLRPRVGISAQFLHALIASPDFTRYIQSVTTGTAVPHISAAQIRDFKFRLPDLDVQRRVGVLFDALDDRIALLRETNATLEAIAQALFKSWFVAFDPVRAKSQGLAPAGMDEATAALFPDGFEESAQGHVPKGWRFAPVGEVVEGIYDGPHATPPESDDGPVFLGIKNLTGTGLDLSEVRHISEDDFGQWTRRVLPTAGDIVFSYEATLGFFALVPPGLRCCLGRRLALIRPRAQASDGHFFFHQFIAAPFQRLLEQHTIQGATVNRIALKHFPSYAVMNPPSGVKAAFDAAVAPIWARIHVNQAQARSLADLRDTLLPRLISGQLRLPPAEEANAEATHAD